MRNFEAIKTKEEATDALVGARCVAFDGQALTFEAQSGERFVLRVAGLPVRVSFGETVMSFEGKAMLVFHNGV